MKVATTQEMREIDRKTIEEYGIPGVVLMENAGAAVVRCMEKEMKSLAGKRFSVLCGRGNNGGDGFVVARYLANAGARVKVFLFSGEKETTGDAAVHLDVLLQMGVDILEIAGDRDWDRLKVAMSFSECLVDALLGTGFHGELSPIFAQAVATMNESGKPIFAVDVPSGVQASDGAVFQDAVRATWTVTFGLPKPGLLQYPGAEYAGKIFIDPIGIPAALLHDQAIKQNILQAGEVRTKIPLRPANYHKGKCGWALILAGAEGYTGAAALAATGALRAGAGRVTLGVAERIYGILAEKLTEVMVQPLLNGDGGVLSMDSLEGIQELAEKADVLALGPGMGRAPVTMGLVRELIKTSPLPLVIDADALHVIAKEPDLFASCAVPPVLTPHPGEMAAMTGLGVKEIQENRLEIAKKFAAEWNSILVLKGAATVVALPDGEIYINTTGNAGMATGGTGDVLTGMIAAFIAQGCSSRDAALLGVYLHGLAGDLVAKNHVIGMTAGEVATAIPAALRLLGSENK